MEGILKLIAALFLGLFAAIWLWVAKELWDFEPTAEVPTLVFTQGQASFAGVLSAGVAAATAAVLGIEIQKARAKGGNRMLYSAIQASWLLKAGVLTYLLVGLVNCLVWFGNTEVAPEMIAAFALGVVGWMAGAFAAVFQSSG